MVRVLAVLLLLGLIVYSFIDCVQTPPSWVRALPKALWLLVIAAVPVLGAAAWLLAGRPSDGAADKLRRTRPRTPPLAPDDDPDFLRKLGRPTTPGRPEPREAQGPDDDEPEDPARS